MRKRKKNNFKKMRFEDTQSDYVIKSEPLTKQINLMKMKHFSEVSPNQYNFGLNKNTFPQGFTSNNNMNDILPNKSNTSFPENPHFSQEYKLNNNNINNHSNLYNNTSIQGGNFTNYNNSNYSYCQSQMNNFYNNYQHNLSNGNFGGFGNFPPQQMNYMNNNSNLSGFIRPMGVNPFNPPKINQNEGNINNNQNQKF